jgi:hypothetical protein
MSSPSDLRSAAHDIMCAPSYIQRGSIARVLKDAADKWEQERREAEVYKARRDPPESLR